MFSKKLKPLIFLEILQNFTNFCKFEVNFSLEKLKPTRLNFGRADVTTKGKQERAVRRNRKKISIALKLYSVTFKNIVLEKPNLLWVRI